MFNIYDELKELIPVSKCIKQRVNNDYLIISSEQGEIRCLNEVAKDFYLAIDEIKTVEEIVKSILLEYMVDRETLETDIVDLIRELQWQGLITLKESRLKGDIDERIQKTL